MPYEPRNMMALADYRRARFPESEDERTQKTIELVRSSDEDKHSQLI